MRIPLRLIDQRYILTRPVCQRHHVQPVPLAIRVFAVFFAAGGGGRGIAAGRCFFASPGDGPEIRNGRAPDRGSH